VPTYVIRSTHPPDQCPAANSKTRELVQKGAEEMPGLAQRPGIRVIAGPFVLGSEHDGLTIVETDRVETVNDFALESGLVQWNSVQVSMAKPLQDALGDLNRAPPPLY
jgi:hypothetical protein